MRISELKAKRKAQSAEGKALELSDISDLSAWTLCAMLYTATPNAKKFTSK